MKLVKKLTCLFLAIVMTMAMGITAFAAPTKTTTSYVITAPSTSHQYEIYQIMTGDFDEKGNISNALWGKNAKATTDSVVSASDLKDIADLAGKSDKEIAATLKKYVTESDPVETISNGGTYTALSGYYLIKDKNNSVNSTKVDAYTLYLFKPLNAPLTITPKTGVPEVEKKVKDINDSTETDLSEWQDSADYDIGDTIPYQLTATLGDLSNYNDYWVKFVDTMTHLTFTKITSVKVGDRTLNASDYSYDFTGDTLTVTIKELITKYGATTGTKVVVEYEATLDNDAVVGSTGNPNEVYLEFKNNPNEEGDGSHGTTPTDKNIVFTYQVDANKFNANNEPLAGATFTLYKWNVKTSKWDVVGTVEATKAQGATNYTASWKGVDDGKYKLEETTVPTGYKGIDPIEFEITASHSETADQPQLISLSAGDKFTGKIENSQTGSGILSTDVINTTTSSLPSTGGMGTTVIYIAGIAMIVAAGVVVIARKRLA